jgi:NADH-quinone oxidoreductase subunit L
MMSLVQASSEAVPTLISVMPISWTEVIMQNPGAWLCWIIPILGALLMLPIAKISLKLRDYAPVLIAGLAVLATMSMLPGLWSTHPTNDYQIGTWINFPNGAPLSFGVLVDPLSIIIANVVAFISFLIVVYSVGYMHGDENVTRYWFFFLFFIGNMLLLVLSDNLIQTLIGWEGVGMCSYGLIGYYYRDNKERWLGGPLPTKMFSPSHAGMKAFIVTGIGDVLLLGAIFIIYNFAGTLNYMELIQTAPIWMTSISAVPGLLSLTAILFLGGPIGKSAQFPLNEWLPEAMAGPTSVSALIHAATMVKAGVYLVARMAPAFYLGRYVANLPEAQMFFYAIAAVGAFTAFLAATQALVALELKKVLAYSTVSQIGFMMLGLGVSGFTEANFLPGLTAGIFHLVSHALFKAALFLCAGSVIHGVETIYMNNMGSLGKEMPFTKILMLLATLSLAGIPPFSGFWSKDAVFVASLAAGGEFGMILYLTAVITALITLVYSARYIYMVFHGEKSKFIQDLEHHGHHLHESPKIMTWPIAILVVIMIGLSVFGLVGFFIPSYSPELYIEHQMELTLEGIGVMKVFEENHLEFMEPHILDVTKLTAIGSSALLIAIGSGIIYLFWYARKINSWEFVSKNPILRPIHSFLWNRWYLNDLYYAVFVNGLIAFAKGINGTLEARLMSINDSAPAGFTGLWIQVRKAQTGWLRVNILYIIGLLTLLLFLFAVKGV